eukprot:5224068-Alexandrium_andersonii.AAC.1
MLAHGPGTMGSCVFVCGGAGGSPPGCSEELLTGGPACGRAACAGGADEGGCPWIAPSGATRCGGGALAGGGGASAAGGRGPGGA